MSSSLPLLFPIANPKVVIRDSGRIVRLSFLFKIDNWALEEGEEGFAIVAPAEQVGIEINNTTKVAMLKPR